MPTTTNYIWDEANLLAEADGANAINTVYTIEPEQYGNLVSSRIANTPSYHHFDVLGSTRQLTNAAGTVTDKIIYDAWGNIVGRNGSTSSSLLWVGQLGYYFDPETNMFSIRERPYESTASRWLSRDPAMYSEMEPFYYAVNNPYSYVRNNPPNRLDPSGLACQDAAPPASAIPSEDELHPVASWRTTPGRGSGTSLPPKRFLGVTCDGCTIDIEIRPKAYRYFRWAGTPNAGHFVDHNGEVMGGLSSNPLDFFSLVVVTICKTNIVCNCVPKLDSTESIFSAPLERDGVGVFIRQCATDVEQTNARFNSNEPCDYAHDLIVFLQQNTRPCPEKK